MKQLVRSDAPGQGSNERRNMLPGESMCLTTGCISLVSHSAVIFRKEGSIDLTFNLNFSPASKMAEYRYLATPDPQWVDVPSPNCFFMKLKTVQPLTESSFQTICHLAPKLTV